MVGVARAGLGVGATVVGNLLAKVRLWHIANSDTGDIIDGDFEAEEINRTIGSSWAEFTALNREHPIIQYLHGNSDMLSFQARLWSDNFLSSPTDKLDTLLDWATSPVPGKRRPPIVLFWAGSHEMLQQSVIDTITNIKYDTLTALGRVRGVTFTVTLKSYTPFVLESGPPPETRFARAAAGDYMELLAAREYGEPLLGDVLRKRHPATPIVQTGQVVKLPSLEAIRRTTIAPTSVSLLTLASKKTSPQQDLRQRVLDRLNRHYTSTIVPGGL